MTEVRYGGIVPTAFVRGEVFRPYPMTMPIKKKKEKQTFRLSGTVILSSRAFDEGEDDGRGGWVEVIWGGNHYQGVAQYRGETQLTPLYITASKAMGEAIKMTKAMRRKGDAPIEEGNG